MSNQEPPRMAIVYRVLESAKDCEDDFVITACRRLIEANRLGWQRHHNPKDWEIVKYFSGD